jgi:hypothetical protein
LKEKSESLEIAAKLWDTIKATDGEGRDRGFGYAALCCVDPELEERICCVI